MDCKLSKDSLIELQLIQPHLLNDDVVCPCCRQRVAEHRNERRIQRIPFTRYNICPRMRRACRKSSVIGILVAILIAIVTLVLSSYINYLISIRAETENKRSDLLILHRKQTSSVNNSSNPNNFLINDPSSQANEIQIMLLSVSLFPRL